MVGYTRKGFKVYHNKVKQQIAEAIIITIPISKGNPHKAYIINWPIACKLLTIQSNPSIWLKQKITD